MHPILPALIYTLLLRMVLFTAIQGLHQNETKRLFPSKWIFPVYRYFPGTFQEGGM